MTKEISIGIWSALIICSAYLFLCGGVRNEKIDGFEAQDWPAMEALAAPYRINPIRHPRKFYRVIIAGTEKL